MRRRAKQDDVDAALDQLLISVEAHEAVIGGDVDLRPDLLVILQVGQALLEPILEGVGHGDQADIGIGGERLAGRAGAPVAAADQPDPQQIAAAGVHGRHRGHCSSNDRGLQKRTPGR